MTALLPLPPPLHVSAPPVTERFREVVAGAVLAEELGLDGFAFGERHERPFLSSSPPVVLSHIAPVLRKEIPSRPLSQGELS
ncbi:hypothetical protein GCM10022226_23910 [Sphaerisporangium flaviroseum]|uniref:Luciferase-like domain-containing protein n=1 Tax=Sphaerisporangium flaviroseum TaxID=509199 RepID=A0ABP7HVV1_9ACTN